MTASEAVFYLLGALAVASSALVVTGRNPISSLLFLVLSFFCLAGLFVTLEAHFLAAIQILIYAGAILVLFLFVIMLLDLGRPEPMLRLPRPLALALAGFATAAFVLVMLFALRASGEMAALSGARVAAAAATRSVEAARGERAAVDEAAGIAEREPLDEVGADAGRAGGVRARAADRERLAIGSTEAIGTALFRDFLLPFEVTSLLLLVAMVGAVMLAKRER